MKGNSLPVCEICDKPITPEDDVCARLCASLFGGQGSGLAHKKCAEIHNRNRLPSIGEFFSERPKMAPPR